MLSIFHLIVSQEDALRLYRALPHEIWETRFLLSCLPIIKKGIRILKLVYTKQ